MTSHRIRTFVKAGAVAVAAGLLIATPASAHKGGGDKGSSSKPAKPVLTLDADWATPATAAQTAVTAVGGGQVVEVKIEAQKKGTRLVVEVLTPTGRKDVKMTPQGVVVKISGDDDGDDSSTPIVGPIPSDKTWATYAAAVPAGASAYKITIQRSVKKGMDTVRVEYYTSSTAKKKAKLRLGLDGTVLPWS